MVDETAPCCVEPERFHLRAKNKTENLGLKKMNLYSIATLHILRTMKIVISPVHYCEKYCVPISMFVLISFDNFS